MSNELKTTLSNLPASIADLFAVDPGSDDLSGGITGGYAIVSIRGSKWRIKHGGTEEPVLNDEGDPRASLEVVMVDAAKNLSKIFYAENYSEGDAEAPDCSSLNGETPDVGVPNKQADSCAMCPNNQWGSRMTDAGKKAKACHDSRRIAVVPFGDLKNEAYGGPMLLRIPAASLGDLKTFGTQLNSKGISYKTIAVRLGFDIDVSYPKLTFKAIKRLEEAELLQIAEHLTSGAAAKVLEGNELAAEAPKVAEKAKPKATPAVDIDFEEEEEEAEEKAPPKKKAAVRAKTAAKKEAAASSVDDELDDILGDLDSLE